MNDQPLPTNPGGAGERPVEAPLEGLQPGAFDRGSQPEAGGMPGNPGNGMPGGPPPAKLSAADVTAAIAAMPGPTPPTASGGVLPTPVTAEDVDVIEPEWVDKLEQTVQQHIGDPYGEEEAVETLQEDYLKKRYGYDVADPKADKDKPADNDKPKVA